MARKDEHLQSHHYPLPDDDGDYVAMFRLRCHGHLIALCDECRGHWEQLGLARRKVRDLLESTAQKEGQRATTPDIDLSTTPQELAAQDERVAGFRRLRRRAQEEAWELLRLPNTQRRRKVRGAHRRFKSRHLAEILLEECRTQVRSAPETAREIAELIPLILRWLPTNDEGEVDQDVAPRWAPALLYLARAQRANALRVAGQLPASERAFAELRLAMRRCEAPPGVWAEIASLEGSLRIDQQRLAEAEDLLGQAVLGYATAGDDLGIVRVQIKHANLLQVLRRPDEVLRVMAEAVERLNLVESDSTAYLLQCTVTARVNALCDLAKFGDANALLVSHLDTYESSEDPDLPRFRGQFS